MVLEATTRHAWLGRLAFAGLLLALLASRLPSPLWTAFWAEDGAVFYADAYNQGGLQALVRPWTGYLQTSGRLVSALLVQFPVAWGPQLATCVALVIDILPAVFLLSHRFQAVIPSFRVRALLALVSIALPDTFELNGNLANTQWHLALLAFLVLVSAPPTRAGWRIVDFGALLLSGLTGVFCLPLAPLAAWLWLRQRSTWRLVATMLLAACALVQGTLLLTHFGQRAGARLQPSLPALLHILDRVLLAPLLSSRGYIHLAASPLWSGIALPLVVGLMGAAAIIYACGRGPLELRLLLLFIAAVLVMTLISPVAETWPSLGSGRTGMRYLYLPMLGWVCVLVWLASRADWSVVRMVAIGLLAVGLLVGVTADWRYRAPAAVPFQAQAERFERAPRGTVMTLPIEFPGLTMTLVRR